MKRPTNEQERIPPLLAKVAIALSVGTDIAAVAAIAYVLCTYPLSASRLIALAGYGLLIYLSTRLVHDLMMKDSDIDKRNGHV